MEKTNSFRFHSTGQPESPQKNVLQGQVATFDLPQTVLSAHRRGRQPAEVLMRQTWKYSAGFDLESFGNLGFSRRICSCRVGRSDGIKQKLSVDFYCSPQLFMKPSETTASLGEKCFNLNNLELHRYKERPKKRKRKKKRVRIKVIIRISAETPANLEAQRGGGGVSSELRPSLSHHARGNVRSWV